MVHMHADKLLADGLDQQRRDNRAVDAARKGQQNLLVTDLLADCGDLLVDERLSKFGSGDTHHIVGTLVGIHAGLLFGSMERAVHMQTRCHMTSLYAEHGPFPIASAELFAGAAVFPYAKVSHASTTTLRASPIGSSFIRSA